MSDDVAVGMPARAIEHCYVGSVNWLQWRERRLVYWWWPWHPIRHRRDRRAS